jgi:hypothetical protein
MISKYLRGCFRHQPCCQWSQLWVVLAEECSRIGACRYGSNLHLGMGKQQAEELSACITSGTCHRSP